MNAELCIAEWFFFYFNILTGNSYLHNHILKYIDYGNQTNNQLEDMEFILYQILWCNMEWYVWHLPRRMLPKIWEEEGFTHFLRVWGYVTQITINVYEILKNFIGKLASMTKSTRTTTPKNSKKSAIHFSCFLIRAKHLSYHEWKKIAQVIQIFLKSYNQ